MHTKRTPAGEFFRELLQSLRSTSPEDLQACWEEIASRLCAIGEQIENERRDSAIQSELYAENARILEERLLRVENSLLFRFTRAVGNFLLSRSPFHDSRVSNRSYRRWLRYQEASLPSWDSCQKQARLWVRQPRISILMATHRPKREWLEQTINSVRHQVYENWQLCICDDASDEPWVAEYLNSESERDSRIVCTLSRTKLGISGALSEASRLIDGEYAGLLDQHDRLHSYCLYYIVEACQESGVQVVYTDEDQLDSHGHHVQPRFKPDWSPDLLTSCMYWGRFWVVERAWLQRAAGSGGQLLRTGFDGAHDYDLALRLSDEPITIRHVPRVLYQRRGFPPGQEAAGRALEDALQRRGTAGIVERGPVPHTFYIRRYPKTPPLVSIIVCSRDVTLFERFLRRLIRRTDYDRLELVMVEHQAGPEAFPVGRFEALWKRSLVHIPYAEAFNFAAMSNLGAEAATGSALLFLNDDVEPIRPDWLSRMLGQVERPEIGVVGARLLYPSGAIQHAGIALGMSLDGVGHPGRFLFHSALFPWLNVTRNVTAVTGACLAIRKPVFEQLGGFDPQFSRDYNDVDLCLRARKQGYLIVLEAGAVLYHRESTTRARVSQYRERNLFHQRWFSLLKQPDPYVPLAFQRKTEEIRLPEE